MVRDCGGDLRAARQGAAGPRAVGGGPDRLARVGAAALHSAVARADDAGVRAERDLHRRGRLRGSAQSDCQPAGAAGARRDAVDPGAVVSAGRPDRRAGARARQARSRDREHHPDLHRHGVESDLQLLSLAVDRAARARRSVIDAAALLVAPADAAGTARHGHRSRLEQRDVVGGRMVLPDGERVVHAGESRLRAPRHRQLPRARGERRQPPRGVRRHRRARRRRRAVGPAALGAADCLEPALQDRARRCRRRARIVGAEKSQPLTRAPVDWRAHRAAGGRVARPRLWPSEAAAGAAVDLAADVDVCRHGRGSC